MCGDRLSFPSEESMSTGGAFGSSITVAGGMRFFTNPDFSIPMSLLSTQGAETTEGLEV